MSVRLLSPSRHCRRGPLRLAVAMAAGLALGSVGMSARADDQSTAEALFDRGRALMEKNATLTEACRTLEQSLKLMDRGDTVLNLAECHRRQGKTATAWAEFDKALTYGFKVGFAEAIQAATRLRDDLASKLSRLIVTVPPATAALEGFTVEVLGNPWPPERWNTGVVLDPGRVRVAARARGYKPFEVEVELGVNKDAKSVVVVLEVEPPPPPPLPPPPALPRSEPLEKPSPALWPWLAGGAGVAFGAVAIGAELVSRSAHSELDTKCGSARQSCPEGYDYRAARSRELLGYDLFVGLGTSGLLALGAAGVGFALDGRPRAQTPGASLVVSPTTVAVRWTF